MNSTEQYIKGIKEKLRQCIRESKKSQVQLASDSGLSEVTICNFKNGNSELTFESICRLVQALGFNCNIFFCISKDELSELENTEKEI